ncbi:MAG: HlyC/CorC family transporter [Clostridia bacterium]|nr:HlyC/CorC family transporter [Clostridia bacterium]
MYSSVIALVILIMFSAYFSATETAFSALNIIKIKNLAQSGNKRAKLTLELYNDYDRLISTILVGNNIVNILSTSLATALFVLYFPKNGVAISTVVMTVVVLVFGEVSPKSIAKEMPEKFAMISAPFIKLISVCLTPITRLFVVLKNLFAKMIGVKSDNTITDDELLTMVKEAQADGGIDEGEGDLIKSAIEFYDLDVSDILIPRVDMIAIDYECTKEEIYNIFSETRFSRIPVFKETVDNIIGVINQKDFNFSVMNGDKSLDDIIKPAAYVVGNMHISDLLTLLQKKKTHLAVVTDEYGGTEGIVTLEDVIEELVGEIWDEHDEVIVDYTRLAENCYRISCNASTDKITELFDIELETDSATVGGWVTEMLEKIPEEKDSFTYQSLTVTVTKADERRALEVVAALKVIDEQ